MINTEVGQAEQLRAFSQNKRLGRGVNVIGYDPIWQSRSEGRMRARHFRLIREAGLDHVRINLHPFRFMGAAPDYPIDPAWLYTLDWAVDQSLQNDLMVILDFHEFGALGKDPFGLQAKFLAGWKQLSRRYQGTPDTVIFEVLNEPHNQLTAEVWNQYLQAPLDIIRETNPQRTLIIGPAFWNGIDQIGALELPEADRNIIVTVHYYHPMPFTHQGAQWTEFRSLSGIEWLGTPEECQAVERDLGKAQAWAVQHQRPLYLGEFGAYDRADMISRARYTGFVARLAESLDWSWGYWQFDSDFVLYDMAKDVWVEPLLHALIPIQGSPEA